MTVLAQLRRACRASCAEGCWSKLRVLRFFGRSVPWAATGVWISCLPGRGQQGIHTPCCLVPSFISGPVGRSV